MAAPLAPTLLTPANMENADPASGQLLTWQFNDPDPGDTQGFYALRRKVAGAGAYSYWDGAAWVTDTTPPSLNSDGSISLYGVANRGARMKNAVAMKITGDIEFVARVKATDWSPGAVNVLASCLVAATSGYEFYIDTTGKLGLKVVKSGPTELTAISSVAGTWVDGTTYWVKMTRASASGNCNFYQAADAAGEPGAWTQIGAANVASTAGAIITATADLWVGQRPNNTLFMTGSVYRAMLRSTIGGAAVVDFDASRVTGSNLSFYGSTGEIWSLIFCPYVTTATQSVTIALASWPNRATYQWSIATQDAGGNAGPFAGDRLLVSTSLPVVTPTAPTGVQASSRPNVQWTYAQVDGFQQAQYRIKIYTAAQYGAGGFSADTSDAVWDSGWISDPTAWYEEIGADLADATTFRAYMQVKTVYGQTSVWAYIGFSTTLALANAPTLVYTPEPDNGRALLTIRADFNLLTEEQADLEGGTLTGWASDRNASLQNSTAQHSGGARSLKITGAGATYAQLDTNFGTYTNMDAGYASYTAQTAAMPA